MKAITNQELKEAGLKATLPRLRILEILETASVRHLSAEAIHQLITAMGEEIGLATIYRVLTQFESAGLVSRLHFEDGHSVFELRQDEHHDHLVCVKCGKVEEFVDQVIEQRQENIAERSGFQITDHSLNIYGICATCQIQHTSFQ
jgi:Fur family ferric uptake transcriptional regulator